ncbi:hypothetical protein HH214_14400 [Mucilaginibacter robiniae]|uniref:Uncharacterized protein n=1 Tax=Mucilaginibacter robiniae TaxID=2728022 RepID=A0A7L5E7Y9_9SPHI|nr:hypothetical protein [Mucilaginibacter robiniae]QJD96973.1 hypothetical protein HH214_14400 [Mucilaginibacter robiniae]
MKLFSTLLLLLSVITCTAQAQTQATPGPAERRMVDSLCSAISRLDMSKIKTSEEANEAFMNCFSNYYDILMQIADEKSASLEDDAAMQAIGLEIGKELMRHNCSSFIKLSVLMSKSKSEEKTLATSTTQGTLKRIENKGFNYFIVADAQGNEKSFLWLQQFAGSEKFMGLPVTYAGKKIAIQWHELEVYLPQAKGYYTVKEVVSITVL